MKFFKKIVFILLPAFVFSLTGCNKKKTEIKTTLTIDPIEIEMYEDDCALVKAETNSTKSVTYSSQNSDVVSVNSSGVLLAKNAGKTYVNASVEDLNASCYVTVKPISEKTEDYIRFDKSLFVIGLNDASTENVIAPTYYHAGEAVGGKSFVYSSSNEEIATVSANGSISVKASGTTSIVVTCDSVTANVILDVYDIVIRTTSDWEDMLKTTQNKNARFYLDNDLDFTDVQYVYYSDFDHKLMGFFEGNYHIVSNITMKTNDLVQSIFGYASVFSVMNIRFINVKFTSSVKNGGLFSSLLQHYSEDGVNQITGQSVIRNVLCDFIFSDVVSCVIADRFYGANVDYVYVKARNAAGTALRESDTYLMAYSYYTWFGTSHFIDVIGLVEKGSITKEVKNADPSDTIYYPDTITEVKTNVAASLIEANYLASLSFDSNVWNIRPNELPSFN